MSDEELNDFVDKATEVQRAVKALFNNDINADKNADDLISRLNADKITKQNDIIKQQKIEEQNKKYKKGDGWKNKYNKYCMKCFIEIYLDVKCCPVCGISDKSILITSKERKALLKKRIDELKGKYEETQKRVERWNEYRKNNPNKSVVTDYAEWELWEPQENLDEYFDDNFVPNNECKAMLDDIKKREAKRKEQMKAALKCKKLGNQCLIKGQFSNAIKHYSEGISYKKDFKVLYNNRALAYWKVKQYKSVIKDTSDVIDMIECVDTYQKNSDIHFKARLRRGNAYKMEGNIKAAKDDIYVALQIKPNKKEVQQIYTELQMLYNDEEVRKRMVHELSKEQKMEVFDSNVDIFNDSLKRGVYNKKLMERMFELLKKDKKFVLRLADKNGIYYIVSYIKNEINDIFKQLKHDTNELKSNNNDNTVDMYNRDRYSQRFKNEFEGRYETQTNIKVNELKTMFDIFGSIMDKKYKNAKYLKKKKNMDIVCDSIFYIFKLLNDSITLVMFQQQILNYVNICFSVKEVVNQFCDQHCSMMTKNIMKYLCSTTMKHNETCLAHVCNFIFELFKNKLFQSQMCSYSMPYFYVPLFNVFEQTILQYSTCNDKRKQSECNNLLSALLTCIAAYFGAKAQVVKRFINSNNCDTNLSQMYGYIRRLVEAYATAINKRNFNPTDIDVHQVIQISKCIDVFVSLSMHPFAIEKLLKAGFHEILLNLLFYIDHENAQTNENAYQMLKFARASIYNYLERFIIYDDLDRVINTNNKNGAIVAPFWKHTIKLLKHNNEPRLRSSIIRLCLRWCNKRVMKIQEQHEGTNDDDSSDDDSNDDDDSKSNDKNKVNPYDIKILEWMIKVSFKELYDMLIDPKNLNNLSVVSNTPLLLKQYTIYSKCIKKQNDRYYKLIYNHTKKKLSPIMNLFRHNDDGVIKNTLTFMAVLAQLNEDMKDRARDIGAFKAMSQLSVQFANKK